MTAKQPRGEIVGNMAKMLKCLRQWSQNDEVLPHMGQVCQVLFSDVLTTVSRLIDQDRFSLIQEAVGVLKWWPELRRRLQPFGQELLQLRIPAGGNLFFPGLAQSSR